MSLNTSGYMRSAVLEVAADLLGDADEVVKVNPEYARAIVQMSRDLIGYTGEAEDADFDVLNAVIAIRNGEAY